MNYLIILVVIVVLELIYFRIADRLNIIDRPNERSSHSTIVLRGGGIIFTLSILLWMVWQMVDGEWSLVNDYLLFIVGLVLISGVSLCDDVKSLPYSVRLLAQFITIALMLWGLRTHGLWGTDLAWYWQVLIGIAALTVMVSATNIINFMDGINGITAGYSLVVLLPLAIKNEELRMKSGTGFIDESFLIVIIIGVLVFCFFNFRAKGKAKCFAGDVGSIGMAFIMLFAIGRLIVQTNDITWLVFLLVYGVDGCCTIFHRMMLHDNLAKSHRKHAYQLMANELEIGHVKVSLLYMALQLAVSLGFIYLCPDTLLAHWIYLILVGILLATAYVVFMKKYYHLHEEYLASLKKED